MAPFVFSSRLTTSINFFDTIAAFKPNPSRSWSAAAAQASPITSSRASQDTHFQAPTSPSSIGKPIALEAASKISARAAWQPPKYVYPDPNPEFARAETKRFQVELMKRLSKNKEIFGEDIEKVVSVCSELPFPPPEPQAAYIFSPEPSQRSSPSLLQVSAPSPTLLQVSVLLADVAPGIGALVDIASGLDAPRRRCSRLRRSSYLSSRPSKIFSNFLHKEYGGPGTLLVEPFTDMLLALKAKKLPGPPVAARAALLWAQNYVDRDWETWTAQTSQ